MPQNNLFAHQSYPTLPAIQPIAVKLRHADPAQHCDASRLHTEFHIRHVLLVHGTFMGDDPLGIVGTLRRWGEMAPVFGSPLGELADRLGDGIKPGLDAAMKDVGNYSPQFRDQFQTSVGTDPRIELLEPTWSSQNHHFARADLAVRLLCRLEDLGLDTNHERVLLWGHSHAGNGFAILSNLLANNRESVAGFFASAGERAEPHWHRARDVLENGPSPHPLARAVLMVTFGTPVRYGWDNGGYGWLLHVSHHRPFDADQPLRAKPVFRPQKLEEILAAQYGDWVQTFAIAGTDLPSLMHRSQNEALNALLESSLAIPPLNFDLPSILPASLRSLCARWQAGTRAHADGRNLFVDYEPCGRQWLNRPVEESVLGHGVATTIDWLPTHVALVLQWLQHDMPI